MRSNLVGGKLVPPSTVLGAQLRHQQLGYEIGKLEQQIDEADNATLSPQEQEWYNRAVGCIRWMREEARQLAAWLSEHGAEPLSPREPRRHASVEEEAAAFWNEP